MLGNSNGHFRALLKRHKARKEKVEGRFEKRKSNLKQSNGEKLEFNSRNLRPSELDRLKKKIKTDIKKDKLNDYLLYFIIFLIMFIAFYFFMN